MNKGGGGHAYDAHNAQSCVVMRTENARQRIRFLGVFWCINRAALCRIYAVCISAIRSIRTPVKAHGHGNYIST